jgi:UPF0755 protein
MSQFGLIPGLDEEESAHGSGRHSRRRRRRRREKGHHAGRLAVLLSLLVVVGLLVGGVWLAQNALSEVGGFLNRAPEDYPGPGTGSVTVVVTEGETLTDIGATLEDSGVVASAAAFTQEAQVDEAATSIQPGTYEMPQRIPASEALAILLDPANRVTDAVVLREGLRVQQTVNAFVQQAGMDADALEAALADTASLGLPAYAQGRPEGFLFPATYDVEPSTTPAAALQATTAKFGEVAAAISLEQRAAALGLSPLEVVTIASIVQAEARKDEDFGKVAQVIYNRLDAGLPLQMDSTVAYANDVFTVFTSDEQRALDSPYNTYKVTGLPPGPINSPGEQALEAALTPTPGPWLYFVTVNLDTGETKYATTFAEHEANVAELQRWIADNPS